MTTRHFQRGQAPTFNCSICGRRTRDTDSDHLCGQCWELAGWDNHHNDEGTEPTEAELAGYEQLVAVASKRGGDADRIRTRFDFLWPGRAA